MPFRVLALSVATAFFAACQSGPASATRREPVRAGAGDSSCSQIVLGQGLDLVVLGSGGPRSAGRAAASYLIAIRGIPRYLIDAGPGAFARLGETRLDAKQLDTVLLTHLHVDHAGDLPGLLKSRDLYGKEPLSFRIVGPAGRGLYPSTTTFVAQLFGSQGAFAYLPSFRNPIDLRASDLSVDLDAAPQVVLDEEGIRISAVAVDHADVPAVAFRVDFGGQSIVISGDLASKRGRIAELARHASVLVYDTAVLDPPGSEPEQYELHTPPRRVGLIATEANARLLVLSHLPPKVDDHRDEVLASVRGAFAGQVQFARDCLHLSLPSLPTVH